MADAEQAEQAEQAPAERAPAEQAEQAPAEPADQVLEQQSQETLMRTTDVFSATRPSELSVRKGEVLVAVPGARETNGWCLMSRGEESGWVPATVLEPADQAQTDQAARAHGGNRKS